MITIRKRISRPFLIIILLIPISILVLFNVIVSVYTRSQAEEDLLGAVAEISNTLNSELSSSPPALTPNRPNVSLPNPNDETGDTQSTLPNMASIINNQSHSTSAELVVFNRNGELSRIFNEESFITDDLADAIYAQTEKIGLGEIGSVRFDGDTYYVIEIEYQTQTFTDKIVYISKGLIINDLVTVINIVLITVSVVVTLLALFVSTRVANAIAKPIERLTSQVENMKSDKIVMIDNRSDSIELQKLTVEINKLNKRIFHYNQSQKNFLHNASHELRTPLMSIQGYADGIEMGIFSDAKGTAHLISDQTKRLTKLVDSLLSLARAENFSTNKKLERLNLSEYLINLINRYNGFAVSNNIEIKADITPDLHANSNSELLDGSAGNIISNAVRYAKSTVQVSLIKHDDKAVIIIKDDGDGIENIDKTFERFSKGEDGNFGLGLSIAKTSIDMMNGKVSVYNKSGAVFEIKINLSE